MDKYLNLLYEVEIFKQITVEKNHTKNKFQFSAEVLLYYIKVNGTYDTYCIFNYMRLIK